MSSQKAISSIAPPHSQWIAQFPSTYTVLPYYAPIGAAPGPLPSLTEIENSKEVMSDNFRHQVVAVGPFVVKYGNIDLQEGCIMLFVKEQIGLPVPMVYALYRHEKTQRNFIVMERVEGTNLMEKWQILDNAQKRATAVQIRNYVSKLRAVPSPKGFCSLGGAPLRDGILPTSRELLSEADFNDGLLQNLRTYPALQHKVPFFKRKMASIFSGHSPVLTHGDLQRKNMIMGPDGKITLLDWETAGWYPSYWEYCHALAACHFQDDWDTWIEEILQPYESEYFLWTAMTRDMWG